jgi:hypothetical protein
VQMRPETSVMILISAMPFSRRHAASSISALGEA